MWSLEDPYLDHITLVLELSEEIRLWVRSINLLDINIVDGSSMQQCLIHIKE